MAAMPPVAPVIPDSPEALARVLAMIMVADTDLDPREVQALVDLDGFARIGVTRGQFMRIASRYCAELGTRMGEQGWLRTSDLELIDDILGAVRDPGKRLLLCRLAAALIAADGRVRDVERLIYDHMLRRWGQGRSAVVKAILADRQALRV